MTIIELKGQLYQLYAEHKQSTTFSSKFINNVGAFYDAPRPEIFVDKAREYVALYEAGGASEEYAPLMLAWKSALTAFNTGSTDAPKTVDKPVSVAKKPVEAEKKPVDTQVVAKPAPKPIPKPAPKSEPVDFEKPVETKPTKSSTTSVSKKSKISISDWSQKTVKFASPNEVLGYMETTLNELARVFLIQHVKLSDQEITELSNIKNTSVYRSHNLLLTRTDQMMLLLYLSMSYLNVTFADNVIQESFTDDGDKGATKLKFYQFLIDSNLIELEIQSDVKRLNNKLQQSSRQQDRIETMLQLLMLERANVPKEGGPDVIKGFIDTSSVMNYPVDAMFLMDKAVGSKSQSVKDYKKLKGD